MEKLKTGDYETCDGNTATTYVAYSLSESAIIYPITPSSPMGEVADDMFGRGVGSVFDSTCKVTEMQSEAGAAGAVHGSLSAGALTTTFTASQGLLLMIPNIYKLVGEMLPGVIHVAARAIAGEALSIFGDFSDIMAVRQTGIGLLGGSSVQECLDMAIVAHMSAMEATMPFIHFFDGFRLSHAVEKVSWVGLDDLKKLFPFEKAEEFRKLRQLTPSAPFQRGTSQGPEVYFQNVEAANLIYPKMKPAVQESMDKLAKVTGRQYHLVDYYGPEDAEVVLITMGSAGTVCDEACMWLRKNEGFKVAVVKVRLYRPFPEEEFVAAIPKSAKIVTVLDRCREPGALGEPLYADVCSALFRAQRMIKVIGGRYGLGSRDFTPAMVRSVVVNSLADSPKNNFTVGIDDDVTHLSLPVEMEIETVPEGTVQVQFWGLGQDGTVGSSKTAIKIIGSETPLFAQGYFAYDAKKAGGLTVSHLRFGPKQISSQYLVTHADYISCNNETYVDKFNVLKAARKGAIFVLNSTWSNDELTKNLPGRLRKQIAEKELVMYNIDAAKVAAAAGLPGRINMVMLTAFFSLSKVLEEGASIKLLKEYIRKMFNKKGEDVVLSNQGAVDHSLENLKRVDYPRDEWLNADSKPLARFYGDDAGAFANSVIAKCAVFEGEDLPVSAMNPGGWVPLGTSKYEKRAVALEVPKWLDKHCIQCNICAFVCPHAVIRPFMITDEEKKAIDPELITMPTQGKGLQDYQYRIQISVNDCTGCTVCVDACPGDADGKALEMVPIHTQEHEAPIWDKLYILPTRGHLLDRNTIKGSQAQKPLLEFSGACAGCGETPYIKLITQLFGERMIIANATGCTTIWGGSAPFCPYTTNEDGEGPSWANSLFEDGAEYGFGMALAEEKRRELLVADVGKLLADDSGLDLPNRFRDHLFTWLQVKDDAEQSEKYYKRINAKLSMLIKKYPDNLLLTRIYNSRHLFKKISQWIFGGDGWAYDIGFGGVDHVLASGKNVNILVVDTEVYSNTGGQTSKATPLSAVHKFASVGKPTPKKDLGQMMMSYGSIFVAQCSMGYNMNQTIESIIAAEAYDGPSLIICYAPCIEHGIMHDSPSGMGAMLRQEKLIVEAGMWPLFNYDPRRTKSGLNPLVLHSKPPKMEAFDKLIQSERRFTSLLRVARGNAAVLQEAFREFVLNKWETYERLSLDMKAIKAGIGLGKREGGMLILYGTETQNASKVANSLSELCDDRELMSRVVDMDDYDGNDLGVKDKIITLVVSTYGQGEMPQSAVAFWNWLNDNERPEKMLEGVKFTVFGLGDSSYEQFCESAKDFRKRFLALGATEFYPLGTGDDQDSAKYETGLEPWLEGLWEPLVEAGGDLLKATDSGASKPAAKVSAVVQGDYTPESIERIDAPLDHQWVPLVKTRTLSGTDGPAGEHPSYEYTFDVSGVPDLQNYTPGYALSVWPVIEEDVAVKFMEELGFDREIVVRVESTTGKVLAWPNQPLPLKEIFSRYLDIQGRVSKMFLNQMLKHAESEEDIERLKMLVSKEGAAVFEKEYNDERKNLIDLFNEFKSVRPPLNILLSIIPYAKPRLYSIASSPNYHRGKIILAVVDHSEKTPSGKHFQGLCTGYLQRMAKQATPLVAVALKSGTIELPVSTETPLIMNALGTGLAPFMSMIYERIFERDNLGAKIGAMALFFGCRYRKVDYIYGEELEKLAKEGTISLHVAFSRDQAHKIYVTDKLVEAGEEVHRLLVDQKGSVFYCGSGGNAPNNVKKAFIAIEQKVGGRSEADAVAFVDELNKNGRYLLESW